MANGVGQSIEKYVCKSVSDLQKNNICGVCKIFEYEIRV